MGVNTPLRVTGLKECELARVCRCFCAVGFSRDVDLAAGRFEKCPDFFNDLLVDCFEAATIAHRIIDVRPTAPPAHHASIARQAARLACSQIGCLDIASMSRLARPVTSGALDRRAYSVG